MWNSEGNSLHSQIWYIHGHGQAYHYVLVLYTCTLCDFFYDSYPSVNLKKKQEDLLVNVKMHILHETDHKFIPDGSDSLSTEMA